MASEALFPFVLEEADDFIIIGIAVFSNGLRSNRKVCRRDIQLRRVRKICPESSFLRLANGSKLKEGGSSTFRWLELVR